MPAAAVSQSLTRTDHDGAATHVCRKDTVICLWRRALSRRSQKAHVTWERMRRSARRWLPRARIVHPWPDERLCLLT